MAEGRLREGTASEESKLSRQDPKRKADSTESQWRTLVAARDGLIGSGHEVGGAWRSSVSHLHWWACTTR